MSLVPSSKKGFTLIEFSIVLVIIGLLIGGILAGQSMTKTSEINSVIRQYTQYDTVIANFRTIYNQYPGDSTLINPPGNADNSYTANESAYAWAHLSAGVGLKNIYNLNYTTFNPATVNYDEYDCPKLKIEQDKTTVACLGFSMVSGIVYYRYMMGILTASATYAPLLPKDMLALDKKIDDGLANSGLFYNFRWGSETAPQCNSGPNYLIENSYACTPLLLQGFSGTRL